jgi:gluconate 2-dehydrogenase gamma chain
MKETNMSKHDAARRAFLVRAAAGAGAVAGAGLVPEAFAGNPQQGKETAAAAVAHASVHANREIQGAFFNHADAATIAAFTERIMPGAPGKAGARDADVQNYIDLALSGAYSDLQEFYRHGLKQLGAYCEKTYKKPFIELSAAQQDEVLTALEADKAAGFEWPTARAFFNTVRTHTMEGMFADPIYGGNKNFAGWELVGFPGAQMFYSPKDMDNTGAFVRAPIIGLQTGLTTISEGLSTKSPARKG